MIRFALPLVLSACTSPSLQTSGAPIALVDNRLCLVFCHGTISLDAVQEKGTRPFDGVPPGLAAPVPRPSRQLPR